MLTPLEVLHEAEIGLVISVGGWILVFPVKTFLDKAKKVLGSFEEKLDKLQTELSTQRTNCLTTLQEQGKDQIKVLEKMSGTLDSMHQSQAEMSGYFKGLNNRG